MNEANWQIKEEFIENDADEFEYELELDQFNTKTTTNISFTIRPAKTFKLLNGQLGKRSESNITAEQEQEFVLVKRSKNFEEQQPNNNIAPAEDVQLKVKCLCRLANIQDINRSSADLELHQEELNRFFQQMFYETCCLTNEKQRAVKQELLKIICEAEAQVEAGQCCERCCK